MAHILKGAFGVYHVEIGDSVFGGLRVEITPDLSNLHRPYSSSTSNEIPTVAAGLKDARRSIKTSEMGMAARVVCETFGGRWFPTRKPQT